MEPYVQIIAGSKSDDSFVDKIKNKLDGLHIPYQHDILSAHRNTPELLDFLKIKEIDRLVYITVAGRSNALSGVVACNSTKPVLACPPLEDKVAYMIDIHSTLRMPSNAPVMAILDPGNAALAAKRILDIYEK